MQLSVMFFGADDACQGDGAHCAKYDDILTIARAADELGFTAVWTPERHFQQVGQVFPNPSVLSAALAVATRRIQLRAGSVVLPLHHPLRVAEEWAVVDNLSRGRVGMSVATGWHSADFVLAPEHYADRRDRAHRGIALLRRLWAGEPVELADGTGRPVAVSPQPRPYSTRLPLWLTSSGNPQTWTAAGGMRTNVLAATVGQTREQLADRILRYREAYQAAPAIEGTADRGTVTLMAHTYVGADDAAARERVRAPLQAYLRSYVAQTAANRAGDRRAEDLDEQQLDLLARFALQRYLDWGSLIGSPQSCARRLRDLHEMGCDEVACFVDFGLGRDEVLASLHRLAEVGRGSTT